jgi:hypothetical protein
MMAPPIPGAKKSSLGIDRMRLNWVAQRLSLQVVISAMLVGSGAAAERNQEDIANARAEMQAALQRLYRVTPRAVEVENEQDA